MKKFEQNIIAEGRKIRFTNFVDEKSFEFENAAKNLLSEPSLEQQLAYANHANREYYLIQITAADAKPALQFIVYVGRPKYFPFFAMASVPSFPAARNEVEESFALKLIGELVKGIPGVMCLRIQSKRFDLEKLKNFSQTAEKQGYFLADPVAPVKTLVLHLEESIENLHAKLSQKTRQKIRHASRDQVVISEITEDSMIEVCNQAMQESRKRTGGGNTDYDFHTVSRLAKTHPDRAKILGLFLKSKPDVLLAYVVGYRSGTRSEYSSAGAFNVPELRALPYNYFLLWDLMSWARKSGARVMDLGGITHGGENDPLKGIARFKRSFPAEEVEMGREMVKFIRPSRFKVYSTLKNIVSGFRWKNPFQPRVLIYD